MGLVMRDGIDRLTHVKRYSRFFGNICVGIAWPGYIAGTGRMSGISPAEMAKSDVVVIWGTNAAATQVNLMTHATRARKEHGAKIVAIDIYPHRDDAAGGSRAAAQARDRRRARLRGHACALPR